MRLSATLMLWLISCSSYAEYSNLAWTIIDSQGQRVYDTDNVLKAGIEQERFTPVRFDNQFKAAASDLFKQVDGLGQIELDAFASPALVDGIQTLVSEFACATHRHYALKPESKRCNGEIQNKHVKEAMPFQDGQYVTDRLEITTHTVRSDYPTRSYDIYLPSVQQAPLSILWGAVHKLGSFLVYERDKNDTVLTVYIDGYRINTEGERGQRISRHPEVVFIVLPQASTIGEQDSQSEAAQFALADADFIVPLY